MFDVCVVGSGPGGLSTDALAIVDALYRFGAGQDLRDRALFESAFTEHATLDFTGPAWRLGASIPVFEDRHAIADTIFAAIGGLDTTHTVTNPRVTDYDGGHATLFALVEAQHLPRGDHARGHERCLHGEAVQHAIADALGGLVQHEQHDERDRGAGALSHGLPPGVGGF